MIRGRRSHWSIPSRNCRENEVAHGIALIAQREIVAMTPSRSGENCGRETSFLSWQNATRNMAVDSDDGAG